ncbi:MurR/RpiR family transcriptional regulator [Vallitalea pronyensis]|uniref:MurR/RpiR family transcriptional regulator n=1 Tax=Vallitalea pronyensis TaxID=1348613 RepID=A0A8J8MJ40_9FIRM|nr:MurR/RpiR family transcriptional regulator [Vallitalea pronyensis]QUI22193.1 MurR/RpiR family transcriptional regulator [Vallitalea pronyensis]
MDKITENFASLSPAQKKVAHFIEYHINDVAFLSAKEIASRCGSSEPTLHRLSKSLGYDKYVSMCKDMRDYVYEKRIINRFNQFVEHKEEEPSWYEKHFMKEINSIHETMALNKEEQFVSATTMILSAKRIYLAGWRAGLTITSPFTYILNYLLGNATLIPQGELAEYGAYMTEKDILICLGFPRYCKNSIRICEIAKQKNVKIISMTDSELSPFYELADEAFLAISRSDGFLDSYVAPLAIMNLLIKQIAYQSTDDIKDNMNGIEAIFELFDLKFNWK